MIDLALVPLLCLAQAPADAGPRPIEPRELPLAARAASAVHDGPAADVAGDAGPSSAGSAASVVVTVKAEPDPVPFGERFFLVVTVTRDRGVRLELPGALPEVASAPRAGEAQRSLEELPGADGEDAGVKTPTRVKETIRIPFVALDIEDVKTPAFLLTAKDGETVDVPELAVRVVVPPEPADAGPEAADAPPGAVLLEAAAPVIAYPVPDQRPWYALGALGSAGALTALVALLVRRHRRRRPPTPAVPPPPPRPAHEVALERLQALLDSGLLQRGEAGTFVERLMDEVLRDYLAARFALPAGTRTTRELVKDLLGIAVAGLDVALVESLLADADLVKFARASIAAEQAHAMATRVRALVETTRAAPPGGEAQ
jgi:hypothetical protein